MLPPTAIPHAAATTAATAAPDAKTALLATLAVVTLLYMVVFVRALRRERAAAGSAGEPATAAPTAGGLATGFVTNFFDTLGIGSFATTTAIYRHWRMVRDERIPGTLNVGHTLPAVVQAFIYTRLVPVEARTLIAMIAAAVLGAWLGAGVVARWPRPRVQLGMGLALLGAATLMLLSQLGVVPAGGDLLGLHGPRFALGVAGNFVLGALMTIGIGLYGPCLILISLLGMNPTAAFPIMMGSCAFLMPVASARFVRARAFDPRAALGLLIGGLPAVLIAAFIVKSLPLFAVRWLVVVVVAYTAVTLLMAVSGKREAASVSA
ncbi:MAG TPA: sulfite exporter TauE/SafE family protein [Gemmatimonadaceae bacterium]|nr:sulfite exporter TauE/SafE family protein [Gemmatimonadaceae bacterium]